MDKIKAKGVDIVAVIAYNDPFVMSAWAKANEVKYDKIVGTPALSIKNVSYNTPSDFVVKISLSGRF